MRKSVLGSVLLTQICYSVLFARKRDQHLHPCKSHLFSQRMVLIFGSNAIRPAGQTKTQTVSLQFGSIDIPCGASFNHNRTISNRLLKHLNLIIWCYSNENHEKKTLWLSLIFHGVQAYSSQIPSLPHLEILSRTRSSAALMAVQRSLPSQSQLGGFRSAMVNQLQGLGSLGFQPCK